MGNTVVLIRADDKLPPILITKFALLNQYAQFSATGLSINPLRFFNSLITSCAILSLDDLLKSSSRAEYASPIFGLYLRLANCVAILGATCAKP